MNLYEKMKSGVYVIAEMSANHAGKIENALLRKLQKLVLIV